MLRKTLLYRSLSELGLVSEAPSSCWAHRQSRAWTWMISDTVCLSAAAQALGSPLWEWACSWSPGCKPGPPHTGEHWRACVCSVCGSAFCGITAESGPAWSCFVLWTLKITEGTLVPFDRLDREVAIKWLFYSLWPLTSHHIQLALRSHFSCDWIGLWLLQQKEAIQIWPCVQ